MQAYAQQREAIVGGVDSGLLAERQAVGVQNKFRGETCIFLVIIPRMELSRRHLYEIPKRVWNVYERCMKRVGNVLETCSKGVRNVCGTYSRTSWRSENIKGQIPNTQEFPRNDSARREMFMAADKLRFIGSPVLVRSDQRISFAKVEPTVGGTRTETGRSAMTKNQMPNTSCFE
jgi:hypothetical protein